MVPACAASPFLSGSDHHPLASVFFVTVATLPFFGDDRSARKLDEPIIAFPLFPCFFFA